MAERQDAEPGQTGVEATPTDTSATDSLAVDPSARSIVTVGKVAAEVEVSIGPKFLQLFSEQLYSSPNKAFEELVSNAWDAGASAVYIGMPEELYRDSAAVWVLDNGESMDLAGLRLLWSVAQSAKPDKTTGRPQIGKFGIGKLSTYLLAHQLTYVCKAPDGVIRAVTMDYRRITEAGHSTFERDEARRQLHINPLPLTVREIDEPQIAELLADVPEKLGILDLIRRGVPQATTAAPDEFGPGDSKADALAPTGTWTLAVMTDLKEAGRGMEIGRIRRMLRTALPLGQSISITFRDEPLLPTKLDIPTKNTWSLGPELDIGTVEISRGKDAPPEVFAVGHHLEPYPHIAIEGIPGRITGTVTLYAESISGGKSSRVAQSNGFFINILGRVVNPEEPYFGLSNLNHSAWARMRAAVRADGLNAAVSVDRESVNENREILVFRAFLRAVFNKVRSEYDADESASWPKAGEILTKKWGTVPLGPLRRALEELAHGVEESEIPGFLLVPDGQALADNVDTQVDGDLVEDVLIEPLGPESPLVRYDPVAKQIIINKDHPFAREYGSTHEQQVLLRDASVVDLLTQAYMKDVGVSYDTMTQIADYRDQMLRLVARVRRRSAIQLAEMLDSVTNDKDALEKALHESLEYLGFAIEPIAGSGEPEGVASAPITPGTRGGRRTYTFTYDAKSSKHGRVANGDVRVSGLIRHKVKYSADYVLVVAPDYEEGALYEECERHKVTPMRAADLSALLLLQGTTGPIPFDMLREMFDHTHPDKVHEWVEGLPARLNQAPRMSFEQLFNALVEVGYQEPDTLTVDVIAREVRKQTNSREFPKNQDVGKVITGLSVLIPDLIRTTGSQVFLGAEPAVIRDVVVRLLSRVPEKYSFVAPRQAVSND